LSRRGNDSAEGGRAQEKGTATGEQRGRAGRRGVAKENNKKRGRRKNEL